MYYKGLDGFRAIAVLMVMMVHYGYLNVGWVGVQMFFVLSGFLITNSLLISKSKNLLDYLKIFYIRRVLRIFPLYFLYVFIFLILNTSSLSWSLVGFLLTFTSNFYAIWNPNGTFDYIGHYWSLAVEEQFYFIWPFLVFYFISSKFKKNSILLLSSIVILGPAIRIITFNYFEQSSNLGLTAVNIMPFSQFDSFATGGFLAYIVYHGTYVRHSKIILWMWFFLIFIIGCNNLLTQYDIEKKLTIVTSLGFPYLLKYNFSFIYGYTLLNVFFGLVIFQIIKGEFKLLENKYLVYIGKISFGIYVLHVPALIFTNFVLPVSLNSSVNLLKLPLFLVLTIGSASISYFFFEKRFLKLKQKTYN